MREIIGLDKDKEPNWQEYRKLPVVVKAFKTEKELLINTLEGTMKANAGDWIIMGVNDEVYPCKPDVFRKTYEAVLQEDAA